jgi:hypothetical protein
MVKSKEEMALEKLPKFLLCALKPTQFSPIFGLLISFHFDFKKKLAKCEFGKFDYVQN